MKKLIKIDDKYQKNKKENIFNETTNLNLMAISIPFKFFFFINLKMLKQGL